MKSLTKKLKYHPLTTTLYKFLLNQSCRKLDKIIFTATTGRSGTLTLIDLFNAIPGCYSEHEPYPAMHDDILHAMSYNNPDYARNIYERVKAINLRRSAAGNRYYLEANHLFIKTYAKSAIEDFGKKAAIIHLVRDPVQVANSIYALQDFPGTTQGNAWWLDHNAPTNHIKIPEILNNDPEFQHPFYKGLWYWYELETRVAYWRIELPNVPFFDIRTEDLNVPEKVYSLLDNIGIQYNKEKLRPLIGIRKHGRSNQKIVKPLEKELAKNMHEKFRQLLIQKERLPTIPFYG